MDTPLDTRCIVLHEKLLKIDVQMFLKLFQPESK